MTAHSTRRGLAIERVWIEKRPGGELRVTQGPRPSPDAVEYMRVMARDEVEKLAFSEEGIDTQQLLNSYLRTIEGQRREIRRLRPPCICAPGSARSDCPSCGDRRSRIVELLNAYAVAYSDRHICGDEMQPALDVALKACIDAMSVQPDDICHELGNPR
jgi:hypothetical protein